MRHVFWKLDLSPCLFTSIFSLGETCLKREGYNLIRIAFYSLTSNILGAQSRVGDLFTMSLSRTRARRSLQIQERRCIKSSSSESTIHFDGENERERERKRERE